MALKSYKSSSRIKSTRGHQKVCPIEQVASASVEYEFKIKHPQEKIIAPVEKSMRGVTLIEEENIKDVRRINSELIRETIRARKREVCRTLRPKLYQVIEQDAIVEILVPRLHIDLTPKNKEEWSPSQEVQEIMSETQTRFEDHGDGRRGGRNRAAMLIGVTITEGEKVLVRG